jgi:ornithine carbamoyltransferase
MRSQAVERTSAAPVPGVSKPTMRDLVSTRELSPSEVRSVLDLAAVVKARPSDFRRTLEGKQLVMFFEKPSLRTRLTFEAGMASLGGTAFFMDQTGGRIDARESLHDIAHNVERWVDVMVLRTFAHSTVEDMAAHASIPVINALSDLEHPCQALADYSVLEERFGNLKNVTLAYVGDGNNVAHSLLLTGALLGSHVRVATPAGYEPNTDILESAQEIADETNAIIEVLSDPHQAVAGADAVYTDAWASMGQEREADTRVPVFQPYQVNDDLMAEAASHAVFMHCLPAHRGQEVTDAVMDSPQSVIFDQAEGRLHVQKAVLMLLLWGGASRFPVRSAHV